MPCCSRPSQWRQPPSSVVSEDPALVLWQLALISLSVCLLILWWVPRGKGLCCIHRPPTPAPLPGTLIPGTWKYWVAEWVNTEIGQKRKLEQRMNDGSQSAHFDDKMMLFSALKTCICLHIHTIFSTLFFFRRQWTASVTKRRCTDYIIWWYIRETFGRRQLLKIQTGSALALCFLK